MTIELNTVDAIGHDRRSEQLRRPRILTGAHDAPVTPSTCTVAARREMSEFGQQLQMDRPLEASMFSAISMPSSCSRGSGAIDGLEPANDIDGVGA